MKAKQMQRMTRNSPPAINVDETALPANGANAIAPLSVRIATAVKITGIGRSKLYELIQAGEIEVVKIGSATLIPFASLQRLLDRNRR
jgi:excisionase family DNA binding protein